MPNKVLLFQEGSCHNLKFDFCYVQVRYFDQLREIAAVAGFENKRDIYDELLRRADAIQTMVDRGLTHYDDVFDLLNLYYNIILI